MRLCQGPVEVMGSLRPSCVAIPQPPSPGPCKNYLLTIIDYYSKLLSLVYRIEIETRARGEKYIAKENIL